MKVFGKTIIPLFLVVVILTSCNGFRSTPATSPTNVMETAIFIVRTAVAETRTAIPTATFTATPLPSPLPPTETSIPVSDPIVYYFLAFGEKVPSKGSVVILPNIINLSPTLSEIAHTPDTVTNIRAALEAMINDARNGPTIGNVRIANLAFSEGHADVALQGQAFGAGDIVLIAIRMMILMTVFADTPVKNAIVTLNEKNIVNLGVSIDRSAKPNDYVYTRAEIETFKAENAYVTP